MSEKRYLAYSYYRENDLNKSINLFRQILNSERDLEEDQVTYMKILIQQNKDADAGALFNCYNKIQPSKKKHFNDIFQNLIDKREMAKGLYANYYALSNREESLSE